METVRIVVQVDGKVRGSVSTPAGADTTAIEAAAMSEISVMRALAGRTPQRIVHVPGRLVNLVTR